MPQLILHVDLNSFFASVEQQLNPRLRHQPVGILKALGRSCVIAASNEAKAFAVKTGMSLTQVRSLCPQIILVPAQFAVYETYTRQFIRLMQQFSDVVEVFSLDEVFLDVTYTQVFFGGLTSLLEKIQARVQAELGECLTVSIGVAKNKFLAKLASSLAPKKGYFVINDQNQAAVLARARFSDVCGIGQRLADRLGRLGIFNLGQLAAVRESFLTAEFGPFWAKELKRFSQGKDESSLITSYGRAKSVSRTFTLFKDTRDPQIIKATLRNLIEEACFKLRRLGLVGRQFGLAVRGGSQAESGFITRKNATDSGREVFRELYSIYSNWRWTYPVRFIGVRISLLINNSVLPLFNEDKKQAKIWQTVDLINQSYGEYTVFPATLLNQTIIRPEINGFLGDKQFRVQTSWGI